MRLWWPNERYDFLQLYPHKHFLGLDWGRRFLGQAYSAGERFIFPLHAVEKKSYTWNRRDIESLEKNILKYGLQGCVLGYPLTLEGDIQHTTQETLDFASFLLQNSTHIHDIILWDERYSSIEQTHSEAAATILSDFLCNQHPIP